jgi:hypothetical protein
MWNGGNKWDELVACGSAQQDLPDQFFALPDHHLNSPCITP